MMNRSIWILLNLLESSWLDWCIRKHDRTCLYLGEDLDAYVKIFQNKTPDFYDPVAKDVLVNICLHGMIDTTWFIKETYHFSLLRLMKVSRRINKFVRKTSRCSPFVRPTRKKRWMIETEEKNKGAKASSLNKIPYGKKESR